MSCVQSLINPLIVDVIQRYCLLTSIEVIVGQSVIHSFDGRLCGNPAGHSYRQPNSFPGQSIAFITINFSNQRHKNVVYRED